MYISKSSDMDHIVLPVNAPCLYFLRKRSRDGATPNRGTRHSMLMLMLRSLPSFWCYPQKCLSVQFGNKKKLFSVRANCFGLSDTFRMSGGSLFHWFGPDTEKPCRPYLSVLARGMTRSPWSVERSRGRCTYAPTELQISCKYIGADQLTQLQLTTHLSTSNVWKAELSWLVDL